MASPWKFLARLVSPRRERQEKNEANGDVKPEALTSGEPTETVDDRGLTFGDQPASEEQRPRTQPDPISAEPKLTEETPSSLRNGVGSESAKSVAVAEPVSPEDFDFVKPAHDATKSSTTDNVTRRKHSKRRKRTKTVDVVVRSSPVVPAFSDDALGLDEEIRFLRDRLAGKLRQQNAQLTKMLGRFEC